MGFLTGETDPIRNSEKTAYYTKTEVDNLMAGFAGGLSYKWVWDYSSGDLPSDIAKWDLYVINIQWNNNGLSLSVGDMIIAKETVFGVSAATDRDIIRNVNNSETDPIFSASSAAGITTNQIAHRNTAYSRGNPALMGFLTGETDPIRNSEKSNYYTINILLQNQGYTFISEHRRYFCMGVSPFIPNHLCFLL